MADLRHAAQQALEALDALDAPPSGVVDHYELERRKQALRDALPCTYKCEAWPECACAALAQEEPEPVASIYVTIDGGREFDDWRCPLPVGRNLLYAHPPRREWQGLTEEERRECTASPFVTENYRAIEAALKERNHG